MRQSNPSASFVIRPLPGGLTTELFHSLHDRRFRDCHGLYVAEGLLFHMPGLWQLMFDVERGGRMERLTTDIDLE